MKPTPLKLGKQPARFDARTLQFSNYVNLAALPTPPATFGHEAAVRDYGMLGNDTAGCCVWSAAAHETMLWTAECGKATTFSPASVLSDYAAVTGYDPATGAGDNGTNMLDALNYRRKVGVVDAAGVRHQIGAYVALDPKNLSHLYAALYLFGAVEIGIKFPASAMKQFNAGQPWDVVKGSRIQGGHDIPLVAKRTYLEVVTWGKIQPVTTAFYQKYCDESYCLLSTENLVNGKTLEGFDLSALQSDLTALSKK